jgi:hypothetical protein
MILRFAMGALILHGLYAIAWYGFGEHNKLVFERYAVLAAANVVTATYFVFAGAYVWANKTRLNAALSLHKAYLFLFFGVLTMPIVWGLALNDAPWRLPPNPYAVWIAPAWLRTYVFSGVAVTSLGALFEWWRANWGAGSRPPGFPPDRRRIPYGRRRGDVPPEAVASWDDA